MTIVAVRSDGDLRNAALRELRRLTRIGLLFFFILQGFELLFDVPLGLIQEVPSYLKSLSLGELVVDWIVLAVVVSLLYGTLAVVLSLITWLVTQLGILREEMLLRWGLLGIGAVFLASTVYDIYLVGFAAFEPHILPAGNMAAVSVLLAAAITFAAWRFADFEALKSRLRRAGRIYTIALVGLSVVPLLWGVHIVDPSSVSHPRIVAGSMTAGRPNIIVVIADALSARAMSLYGDRLPTTPRIERLAASGTVIDGLTAVSNWTAPTVATLMSGVDPSTHGIFAEPSHFVDGPQFSRRHVLPAEMQRAGYTTASIVQNGLAYPVHLQIDDAFDWEAVELSGCDPVGAVWARFQNADAGSTAPMFNLAYRAARLWVAVWCGGLTVTETPPDDVYNAALRYIDRRTDASRPFLLWLHTIAPHSPYLPPPPHRQMFDSGTTFLTRRAFANMDDKAVLSLRYREYIHYVDDRFAAFYGALRARGTLRNTIVVFTADHGETFGRWITHKGPYLDEDLIDVPFIVWGPGIPSGARIHQRVSQVDVAPTILDMAGIEKPQQMQGTSLLPLFHGDAAPERPVYAMQLDLNSRWTTYSSGTFAVVDGGWKYVQYLDAGREELFHVALDGKDTNVLSVNPAVADRLRQLLERHFAGKKRRYMIQAR